MEKQQPTDFPQEERRRAESNFRIQGIEAWLNGLTDWVSAAFVAGGAAIHYFRNLAGK